MIKREELEQREVDTLIDRLSAIEIRQLIRMLKAALASRQASSSYQAISRKYDCEYQCCLQDNSEKSRSCFKKVEMHLPCCSVLIEACHGYYRFYLIGKNNDKVLIDSGKRGSIYRFLSTLEKLDQNQ